MLRVFSYLFIHSCLVTVLVLGAFDQRVHFHLLDATTDASLTEQNGNGSLADGKTGSSDALLSSSYKTAVHLTDMACVMQCEEDERCAGVWVQPLAVWQVQCYFVNTTSGVGTERPYDFWVKVSRQNVALTPSFSRNFFYRLPQSHSQSNPSSSPFNPFFSESRFEYQFSILHPGRKNVKMAAHIRPVARGERQHTGKKIRYTERNLFLLCMVYTAAARRLRRAAERIFNLQTCMLIFPYIVAYNSL